MKTFTPWRGRVLWVTCGAAMATLVSFFGLPGKPSVGAVGTTPTTQQETVAVAKAEASAPLSPCYLGVVLAGEKVTVGAPIEGHLGKILVEVGDRVVRGQTLAVVVLDELRHEVVIEDANLANARARKRRQALHLEDAARKHQRQQALADIIPRAQVEEARFLYEAAKAEAEIAAAEVVQVEARRAQLQEAVDKLHVSAPFDGTVALRFLDVGAMVSAGTPVVQLLSTAGFQVRFAVPPEEAATMEVGGRFRVEIEALDLTLSGVIKHRAPEIDSASQMLFVTAKLQDLPTAATLPTGAVARVGRFPVGTAKGSCLGSVQVDSVGSGRFSSP